MTAGTRFYRLAARLVAPILRIPGVRSVYIRRSVAAGEAEFPWSDLDLGLIVESFRGVEMNALLRRFRIAQLAFPRLGECQIATGDELIDLAFSDQYRASLDRRLAVTIAGDSPHIPPLPISQRAAARRLVYWFEAYLPRAVRQRNLRNQWKFTWEMWNALGVIEGRWVEPLATRRETAARADGLISDALTRNCEPLDSPFTLCCKIAARAARQWLPPVPTLSETVILTAPSPLVVLPNETTHWPGAALKSTAIVVTPEVLQLMLETQSPFLWLTHGLALGELGFTQPSKQAWMEACLRLAGGDRLRGPGFMEKGTGAYSMMLELVSRTLAVLEQGKLPAASQNVPAVPKLYASVSRYYLDEFDRLSELASQLRQRANLLLATRKETPCPPG